MFTGLSAACFDPFLFHPLPELTVERARAEVTGFVKNVEQVPTGNKWTYHFSKLPQDVRARLKLGTTHSINAVHLAVLQAYWQEKVSSLTAVACNSNRSARSPLSNLSLPGCVLADVEPATQA